MCFSKPKIPAVSAPVIAAPNNGQAEAQADAFARARRRRQSAASAVLTSPVGIPSRPSTDKLGG